MEEKLAPKFVAEAIRSRKTEKVTCDIEQIESVPDGVADKNRRLVL